MINDEKLRTNIREAAKKMQREGIKIAPGIKELRKLYNFPQKDIHIIWAEGREELKVDKAKEEVMKKIGEENERILNKVPYAVTEKEIEENKRAISVNQVVKELGVVDAEFKAPKELIITPTGITTTGIFKESKLKILEQTIKGEFGTYVKSSEGVREGQILYEDIKHVQEVKTIKEADFKATEESLREQIEDLNIELYNLNVDRKQEHEKYLEIEEVFNI